MPQEPEHQDAIGIIEPPHVRAELAFSAAAFLFAVFLWFNTGAELKTVKGASALNQPGFWSLLSIYGMLGFGVMNLGICIRRNLSTRQGAPMGPELLFWLRSAEFTGWFLAYVLIVPRLGYLPSTLLFSTALTLRLGYRSARFLWVSVGLSLAVVLFFRSFLQVKIPAGAAYELLPAGLRNLFLIYL